MAEITTNTKNFDDNDIMFLKNKNNFEITLYLVDKIKRVCKEYKILYLSCFYSKEELLNKFEYLNNRDIDIIEDSFSTIDEIEKHIINNKYNYVFVDYLKLFKNKNTLRIGDKKIKYVSNKIEELSDKYNVFFMIVVNMEDK